MNSIGFMKAVFSSNARPVRRCCATVLPVLALLAVAATPRASAPAEIHHDLSIAIHPTTHELTATDDVTLRWTRPPEGPVSFLLHADLLLEQPTSEDLALQATSRIEERHPQYSPERPLQEIRIEPRDGKPWPSVARFRISYGGKIHHPLQSRGEDYARSFEETPGTISEEGIFLSGTTGFYPLFDLGTVTFRLKVTLPPGWSSVSQGKRSQTDDAAGSAVSTWDCLHPMDEIYLVAAPFHEYADRSGGVDVYAFLRTPDPELARRYMDATGTYLDLYGRLIGDYPYSKFALVENFWETGYGMPSFTLLGPAVIRLPFILHTSYPHEILHNWWGNGVFVDYEKGNWCEGLTAYLADHLLKEEQGKGEEYRRSALEAYLNYAAKNRDIPLVEFTERHSSATQAVGYGKSAMIFHMLRRELGDEAFLEALREFYGENLGRYAGFDDLRPHFEKAGGVDLKEFFRQWIQQPGAPEIEIAGVEVATLQEGCRVTLDVAQVQDGEPFKILLPVGVTFKEGEAATSRLLTFPVVERNQRITFDLPSPPLALQLDPAYDLFRKLDRLEVPPTVGQTLGAEKVLIVLPEEESASLREAYERLAETWRAEDPERITVRTDSGIEGGLPAGMSAWVLGRRNRFAKAVMEAIDKEPVVIGADSVELEGNALSFADHSFVFAARHPADPALSVTWVTAAGAEAVPSLGRKVVHYGKYSYLAFEGPEVTNVAKGAWSAENPKLVRRFGGEPADVQLPPGEPLARPKPLFSAERMRETVQYLASDQMKGRGLGSPELDDSAEFIASRFREYGLTPWKDVGYFQVWEADLPDGPGKTVMKNVLGILPGTHPERSADLLIVGAHYDHLGLGWPDVHSGDEGEIHNGADDNASGVAVLLELARVLGQGRPDRTIVFAAFTAEEAGRLGSKRLLSHPAPFSSEKIFAMVNLDTVGRLGTKKLIVFGSGTAREMGHIVRGSGYVVGLEAEMAPTDPGGGDQVSFVESGIPAIQLFTGPHDDYHRPGDDPEKLDYDGMARVAAFASEIIGYLSSAGAALTPAIGDTPPPASPGGGRKVSLGSVPDFAFDGAGVRLSGVTPDSPAERAGLREGDVLVSMDGKPIGSLGDLSSRLKEHAPGDEATVEYIRDGKRETVRVVLTAR